MNVDIGKHDASCNGQEFERAHVEGLPLIAQVAIGYAVAVVLGLGLLAA